MSDMNTTLGNSPSAPQNTSSLPVRTLIVLVLGLLAAWLAAGSLGWLAPPLQRSLTWLTFAGMLILAVSGGRRVSQNDGLLLGGAMLIAVLMTASALTVVNILAVAILLVAIAQVRPGLTAMVCGSAALAVATLAVYRLVCDSAATAWTLTNNVGHAEGLWAGWLTGRTLRIGASFGGVDFLVLMAALAFAWLFNTPQPRLVRAAWAALFICLAQTAYLVILAFNHDIAALLPPQLVAKPDDISHLGIWTWGNTIRALLPWNLPALAAVFHSAVAVVMFRIVAWPLTPYDLPGEDTAESLAEGRRRNRGIQGESSLAFNWQDSANWLCFGPAVLLIVAAVVMTFSRVEPDLTGRRIVIYDDGGTDWSTTDPGSAPPGRFLRFGLLPVLIEGLGGQCIRSRELTDADLRNADVLIVLPPHTSANAVATTSISSEIRERIARYVAAGGRMVLAGEPETSLGVEENVLNDLLKSTAMSFRDDTANSLTQRWEYNLQSAPHAATATSNPGWNHFSFDRAASIRVSWPAGPLVVGRWAWDELGTDPDRPEALPYSPGDHLGDLALAAQQNVGKGVIVVLGSAACLSNDGIPFSYPFTAPLFCALAANHPTPLAWWRQLLGIAAVGAAIVLMFRHAQVSEKERPRQMLCVVTASIALAMAVIACNRLNDSSSKLWTSGSNASTHRPIIYVDGSHLEAVGKDPWGENGTGRLMRVLADCGYLPLVAPDLTPARLNRAAMLISIAPAHPFGASEITAVKDFVEQGGFFLSIVGSPEAGPSRSLLEEFNLHIKPIPVPPWVREPETTPLGLFWYPNEDQPQAQLYASWPVSGPPGAETWSKPAVVGSRTGKGQAFLIGDTAFALNKNFESSSPNAGFWHGQLKSWLGASGERPPAIEPSEGGLINLPKLKTDKGTTP